MEDASSSSYLGAREPEEGKLYKVRQGLITVMVENSYWSGEWGSQLTFWHQIGREKEANACGSHMRYLRLKLSLSLCLSWVTMVPHLPVPQSCAARASTTLTNLVTSQRHTGARQLPFFAVSNMMGYGALNPDPNLVLEHPRSLCGGGRYQSSIPPNRPEMNRY